MLRTVMRKIRPALIFVSSIYFVVVNFLFSFFHLFTKRRFVTPPHDDFLQISATQAAEMIINGDITSVALVDAYIQRIEQVNSVINAVVEKNFDEARRAAEEVDRELERLDADSEELHRIHKERPLLGVPFTLKDCIQVEGLKCTIGIKKREDTRSEKDAVVIERLRAAGAIVLAITNVPEVCMWWEAVNTIYGRTNNPYDTRHISGGSSGGEAALIASAGSVVGVGSDIGGSIRMPAFFNGVFGLKPTPGIIPLTGHLPPADGYRAEMLRIGPICRYAEDLGLMLKVMGGSAVDELLKLHDPVSLKKLRVFYMEGLNAPFIEGTSYDMKRTLKRAVQYFERKYDLVAVRVDLPLAHLAGEFFFTSMDVPGTAPMNQHLANLEGEVNCLWEMIKFPLGGSPYTFPGLLTGLLDKKLPFTEQQKNELYYKRDRLIREIKELLGEDGVLLFPSHPTSAPFHIQPLLKPLNFAYTALFNALAVPVVQCPLGKDGSGLPLGVQVVGPPASDRLLIAVAKDLEEGFGGWQPPEAH